VGQYTDDFILNVIHFVVSMCGVGHYREELILNITLFVLRVLWGYVQRNGY
jgi:uncharacterized membrane protein YqaE (UPF0057 family)